MTREPQFISSRPRSPAAADLRQGDRGRSSALTAPLVGKAVFVIGMLAREFVFVFHEGASAIRPPKPPVSTSSSPNGSDGGSR